MVRREGAFDGATCVSRFSAVSEAAGTPYHLQRCHTHCCAGRSCYKETVDLCRAPLIMIMTTSSH